MLYLIAILTVGMLLATVTARSVNISEPIPPPDDIRKSFDLNAFYEQWIDVEGLPVVASAKVNPFWLVKDVNGQNLAVSRAKAEPGRALVNTRLLSVRDGN